MSNNIVYRQQQEPSTLHFDGQSDISCLDAPMSSSTHATARRPVVFSVIERPVAWGIVRNAVRLQRVASSTLMFKQRPNSIYTIHSHTFNYSFKSKPTQFESTKILSVSSETDRKSNKRNRTSNPSNDDDLKSSKYRSKSDTDAQDKLMFIWFKGDSKSPIDCRGQTKCNTIRQTLKYVNYVVEIDSNKIQCIKDILAYAYIIR